MARNRSTRRMRIRRSKSRSKRGRRGGVLRMFQSEDMITFTDILRDNNVIKDKYMDDNSANLFELLKRYSRPDQLIRMKTILFGENPDSNDSFIKLKQFWSTLTTDRKDKLKKELEKAKKQFLYMGVFGILEKAQISPADPADPAAGENTSSPAAALLSSSSSGGKSRRRHARRTNKKSRKSHKVRKSHRRKHRAVRR